MCSAILQGHCLNPWDDNRNQIICIFSKLVILNGQWVPAIIVQPNRLQGIAFIFIDDIILIISMGGNLAYN